jgi:hypothetical protein
MADELTHPFPAGTRILDTSNQRTGVVVSSSAEGNPDNPLLVRYDYVVRYDGDSEDTEARGSVITTPI